MAWQTEMVRILRHLIDDLSSTPTYDDSRLQELLLVSSQLMLEDISFDNDYTIDVDELTLTPDPTTTPKDNAFINLACLKSACILYTGIFRQKAAKAGFSIRSGTESISTTGFLAGYKQLMDTACKNFKDAKWEYEAGNRIPGKAIIGPYAGEAVEWLDHHPNGRYGAEFH